MAFGCSEGISAVHGRGMRHNSREKHCQKGKKQEKACQDDASEVFLKQINQGVLKICTNGHRKQYYWKNNSKNQYINQKDMEFAKALAQRSYAEKVQKGAKHNLEAIRKFLRVYDPDKTQKIYQGYCQDRKALVRPYIRTARTMIEEWEAEKYEPKGFEKDAAEIYTEKGERVRSKSEKILADKFYMMHIPYHYEKPLFLQGFGTIYPDFTVLNVRTQRVYYYEHFGMMDKAEYCEKAISKINLYEKNGIFVGDQLLTSYETRNKPLDIQAVSRKIKKYFL